MRLDTWAMITKGGALFTVAATSALISGLSQWVNAGTTPSKIEWTMIIAGCIGAGATQLVSFLSDTFGAWRRARNGEFGPAPKEPPKP